MADAAGELERLALAASVMFILGLKSLTKPDSARRVVLWWKKGSAALIARIVTWAVEKRWLVLLLTAIAAVIGAYSLYRLPIDAVPDITNNQVQINTVAQALSPFDVEKQVTYPVETALAGIPGLESTRSLSRNGFSQVIAVFEEEVEQSRRSARWRDHGQPHVR